MCNSSKLTNSIRNYVKYVYTDWPQKYIKAHHNIKTDNYILQIYSNKNKIQN